jgi:alpha-methylacyl-CoA racemase
MLDGGAHFYGNYETKDGKYISVGAIEPEFYAELIQRLGIDAAKMPKRMDRAGWPQWRAHLAVIFAGKTLEEWCDLLEGTDACFAPVLTFEEASVHPQNRARGTFTNYQGITQPAPSPRFSLTPGAIQGPAPRPGENSRQTLTDWGLTEDEIEELIVAGVVHQADF